MDYDEFRLLHNELIGLFQLIESDLKWIFSIIENGDVDDNFSKIEKFNLGKIIKDLKSLDNSDGHPFISANDYNFLKQMKEKKLLASWMFLGFYVCRFVGELKEI